MMPCMWLLCTWLRCLGCARCGTMPCMWHDAVYVVTLPRMCALWHDAVYLIHTYPIAKARPSQRPHHQVHQGYAPLRKRKASAIHTAYSACAHSAHSVMRALIKQTFTCSGRPGIMGVRYQHRNHSICIILSTPPVLLGDTRCGPRSTLDLALGHHT